MLPLEQHGFYSDHQVRGCVRLTEEVGGFWVSVSPSIISRVTLLTSTGDINIAWTVTGHRDANISLPWRVWSFTTSPDHCTLIVSSLTSQLSIVVGQTSSDSSL